MGLEYTFPHINQHGAGGGFKALLRGDIKPAYYIGPPANKLSVLIYGNLKEKNERSDRTDSIEGNQQMTAGKRTQLPFVA